MLSMEDGALMETGASAVSLVELDSKNAGAPAPILLRLMAAHNVQDSTRKQNHAIMVHAQVSISEKVHSLRAV